MTETTVRVAEGPALVLDRRRQGGPRGGLVVERRQHQAVVTRLDQQSREHGDARTDGKAARRPGDGIREYVAVDAKLHYTGSFSGQGGGRGAAREDSGVSILPRRSPTREGRPVCPVVIPRPGRAQGL